MSNSDIDYLMGKKGLLKVPKKDSSYTEQKTENSYRKVAKFLVLIGVDEASKILQHLSDTEVEKLVPEIASIRSVPQDEAALLFAEFKSKAQSIKNSGGVETARVILEKAFGKEKAQLMVEKSIPFPEGEPFDYLNEVDDERLWLLLKDEGIPVKALVLSKIKRESAANLIRRMNADGKKDIVVRLAKMKSMDPEVVRRVNDSMKEKLSSLDTIKSDEIDGRGALAEILKKMSCEKENTILETIGEQDPDLEHSLRERLFTTDDVIHCDNRYIQKKLHAMEDVEIAMLIAGKALPFREKILSNISQIRSTVVLEEEQLRLPMKKKECSSVTTAFIADLRSAWERGSLILSSRDQDVFV